MTCETWPVRANACDLGEEAEVLTAWAQRILSSAVGHRYGICTYTERIWPEVRCSCLSPGSVLFAALAASQDPLHAFWECSCCRLPLAHGPIRGTPTVTVAGSAFTAFLVSGSSLIRNDGSCWPSGDGCAEAPIVVAYTAGIAPPPGTSLAMGELACELARAFRGEPCRLPSRVTSLVRQGVSMDFGDPAVFLGEGLLGLPLCDTWIRSGNRNKLPGRSAVLDPLAPQREVRL